MTDDWETPIEAWKVALKKVPRSATLWDPFVCEGRSQIYLQDLGFRVTPAAKCVDKTSNGTCECMNLQTENLSFDILVTNPPFSQLESVVPWLLQFSKPLIFLVPVKVTTRTWFKTELENVPHWISEPTRIAFIHDGRQMPFVNFDSCWVYANCQQLENKLKRKHITIKPPAKNKE